MLMKYEKVLVVIYSRTGTTKKVALKLNQLYGFEVEEIIDKKTRIGALNYLLSAKEALKEKEATIKQPEKDVAEYDLVIIGTPVWASNMAPAVRTYINKVKAKINNVAFICTEGASGAQKTLVKLQSLIEKPSKGNLVLMTKDVTKDNYEKKLKEFIAKLN